MPRRSKGPRLWLRPARRKGGRSLPTPSGSSSTASGISPQDALRIEAGEAEKRLAAYIADKYQPARHARDIDHIDIADVLSIYLDDCGPRC